jgi:hypothetical protein
VNNVYLGKAFWGAGGGMNVMSAEITPKFERLWNRKIRKVLVSKGNDFALGN